MNETQYKIRALKELKKQLPGAFIIKISDKFHSGIPDIFILWNGIFAAVELKVKNNPATKLQIIILARIAAAGGITQICRDIGDGSGIKQIRAVCDAIKEKYERTRIVDRVQNSQAAQG